MKPVQSFYHLFNQMFNCFFYAGLLVIFLHPATLFGQPIPVPTEAAPLPMPEVAPPAPAVAAPTGQATPTGGPETVSLGTDKIGVQGNWMKKKDWLLRSNEVFEEIQNNVLEIQTTKKAFNEKYHTIDGQIDDFYKELCVDQGKLQELFDSVERYLEKKKKKDLAAVAAEDQAQNQDKDYMAKLDILSAKLKKDKEELEQLKLDIKSIEDLDQAATERLKKVDEQITQTQEEFAKVQSSISDLWDIIDDKKARTIYYELKGNSSEKIKGILSYLKDDLLKDFDSIAEKTQTQVTKIKESIKKLEERGYIIKDRSKRVEKLKLQELQQQEEAKRTSEQIPVKEELFDPKKAKRPLTLYDKVYDYVITTISKGYRYFLSFFQTTPIKTTQPKTALATKSESTTTATPTEQKKDLPVQQPIPTQTPPPLPPAIPLDQGTSQANSSANFNPPASNIP